MRASVVVEGKELTLELVQDAADGRWRWTCDGEDTEVSAPTFDEALEAGYQSWKFYNFRLDE